MQEREDGAIVPDISRAIGGSYAHLPKMNFDKVMPGESSGATNQNPRGCKTADGRRRASTDEALRTAAEEARNRGTLGAVLIEAANGNVITMVVGGDETVLGFDYGHHNPPYYSSRGPSNADESILTCQLKFQHHTQFPHKYVIPIAEGMKAVREFLHSDDLPPCITWGRNCESREDECYGDVTPTECSLQLPPKLTLHNI